MGDQKVSLGATELELPIRPLKRVCYKVIWICELNSGMRTGLETYMWDHWHVKILKTVL